MFSLPPCSACLCRVVASQPSVGKGRWRRWVRAWVEVRQYECVCEGLWVVVMIRVRVRVGVVT